MSTNCLVTKLKASVNNDELLGLGEIKMKVGKPYSSASYGTMNLLFYDTSKSISVDALEGSIKAAPTGSSVTHLDLLPPSGNDAKPFYFDGDVVISIHNKYNLKGIDGSFSTLKVFGYGDIVDMTNTIPNFNTYQNMYTSLFGDLKKIAIDYAVILTDFTLEENSQKLSDLALKCPNLTSLETIGLEGNLSSIENLTNLIYLKIDDTRIEGDVALLPVKTFISKTTNYLNFSWSSRDSTKELILGDVYLATPADRKRMLVDNSNCVRSDQSTTGVLRTLSIDTTDPEIAAALTRLRGKNVEVRRENNTVLN